MSFYEHVIISRPDVSPAQVETMIEETSKKIENLGGRVEGAEYWGLRNLAYRMNKNLSLIHISEPRDQRGSRMPSSA